MECCTVRYTMKLFVNNENKRFIGAAAAVLLLYAILSEALIWIYCKKLSVVFLFLFLFLAACILTIYVRYLLWQSRIIKKALHQIEAYPVSTVIMRGNYTVCSMKSIQWRRY